MSERHMRYLVWYANDGMVPSLLAASQCWLTVCRAQGHASRVVQWTLLHPQLWMVYHPSIHPRYMAHKASNTMMYDDVRCVECRVYGGV